jgi:transposase
VRLGGSGFAGRRRVSPPNPRSERSQVHEKGCIARYRVELFLHKLKRFRCLATRFEKTAQHYLVFHVACSML